MRASGPALLALLVLGACRGEGPAASTLIWARSADSATLDPAEVEWGEDAKIVENLYEGLVAFGSGSVEVEPRLAERWSISEDGLTWTFELRSGIRFHDGAAFDAEAAAFSLRRLIDPEHPHRPKLPPPYGSTYADLDRIDADGPSRLHVRLKRPSALLLQHLALFSACIVSPPAVKREGAAFPRRPSGTGPYLLAAWDPDVRIVLDRFDGYWGPRPAFARVIVIPVKSPQTAIEKLRRGEVHVVDHPTLADVKALQGDPAVVVDTGASMSVCYLGFNLTKPPYDRAEFRRAVSLALDRDALNQIAYHGLAEPASNLVPPAIWKDLCPTPPYERDLEQARELVAKFPPGSRKVELIHMTFGRPYIPEPQRVAEWVKDQLGRIGLEVTLTGYDKAAYTQKYKEPSHPMYLLGWFADIADPDNFFHPLLHGDSKNDMNGSFFDDPAFNSAVTEARGALDASKRRALYAVAYGRYRDAIPTLPLVHVPLRIVRSRKVAVRLHPFEYRFYEAWPAP
jgi:peptide/nickel transport system substrate-binding protein